jgi:hypothetical protein
VRGRRRTVHGEKLFQASRGVEITGEAGVRCHFGVDFCVEHAECYGSVGGLCCDVVAIPYSLI